MTHATPTTGRGGAIVWVAALFLLAGGLRLGWVLYRWGPAGCAEQTEYPDEDAYVLSARSLAAGGGLSDEFGYRATYMPGYPAFLAVFQSLPRPLFWARIAQAILAAWVAPGTYLLARRFLDAETAPGPVLAPVLAGLAAACDPFLIFFSGLLLTEALFAAVLVTAWVFVQGSGRKPMPYAVGAAVFMWGAVMLRPSAAALVLLTPFVLAILGRFRREVLVRAVMIPLLVMVGLVPWAVRNYAVIGQWRWLTTRGGISLYDGLRPGATGSSDLAHTKTMEQARGLSELDWDDYFRSAAWDAAWRDPAGAIRLAGRKFLRTWSLTPNVESYRGGATARLSAAWMSVMLGLAVIGWWRCRRRLIAWVLLLLPVAAFTFLHMIYVGSVRYRVPVMPFVVVLSAVGAATILAPSWMAKTARANSQPHNS